VVCQFLPSVAGGFLAARRTDSSPGQDHRATVGRDKQAMSPSLCAHVNITDCDIY